MEYLHVGESLMLSLTCKSMYEIVESIARSLIPFVPNVQENQWSITVALNAYSEYIIRRPCEIEELMSYLDADNSTENAFYIPKNLTFYGSSPGYLTSDDILKLIGKQITNENSKIELLQVKYNSRKFEKVVQQVPVTVGFKIRNLVVNSDKCTEFDLYRILAHCPNLECLSLYVTDDGLIKAILKEKKRKIDVGTESSVVPWNQKQYPGFQLFHLTESKNVQSVVANANIQYQSRRGYYQLQHETKVQVEKYSKIIVIDTTTGQLTSGSAVFSLLVAKKERNSYYIQGNQESGLEIFVQCAGNKMLPNDSYLLYEIDEHDIVMVPVLIKLKKLSVVRSYDDMGFIIDLLQFTPNLESLELVYQSDPPDDKFLLFLTQRCPSLRELLVRGDDDDGETPVDNYFTDKGIVQFLDNMPSVTSLVLCHCCQVSGEVFTRIGKYSQLKTLYIERDVNDGNLVDQYDNVHFGGGVLESLEVLGLNRVFEKLPVDFSDTVIKTAPNLKRVYNGLGDTSKLYQKCNRMTHIDLKYLRGSDTIPMNCLISNNHLRELSITCRYRSIPDLLSVEQLKQCNWSNLEKLKTFTLRIPNDPSQWLRALAHACPNLTVLKLEWGHFAKRGTILYKALMEILIDPTIWPHLKKISPLSDNINSELAVLRPLIFSNEAHSNEHEFLRAWLIKDVKVKQKKRNPIKYTRSY